MLNYYLHFFERLAFLAQVKFAKKRERRKNATFPPQNKHFFLISLSPLHKGVAQLGDVRDRCRWQREGALRSVPPVLGYAEHV